MSAKFRQAFYPSGAKDDPTDADLQLDILLQHRDRLTAWRPDDATTRQLQPAGGEPGDALWPTRCG